MLQRVAKCCKLQSVRTCERQKKTSTAAETGVGGNEGKVVQYNTYCCRGRHKQETRSPATAVGALCENLNFIVIMTIIITTIITLSHRSVHNREWYNSLGGQVLGLAGAPREDGHCTGANNTGIDDQTAQTQTESKGKDTQHNR